VLKHGRKFKNLKTFLFIGTSSGEGKWLMGLRMGVNSQGGVSQQTLYEKNRELPIFQRCISRMDRKAPYWNTFLSALCLLIKNYPPPTPGGIFFFFFFFFFGKYKRIYQTVRYHQL